MMITTKLAHVDGDVHNKVVTDSQGHIIHTTTATIPEPPKEIRGEEYVHLLKKGKAVDLHHAKRERPLPKPVLKKRTIVTETVTEEYEVVKPQRDLSNVGHVVYFIKCNEFTKIGYTNNIQERMTVLQVGNPYELEIVDLIECDTQLQAQQLEKELHTRYQASHIRGEWYKL